MTAVSGTGRWLATWLAGFTLEAVAFQSDSDCRNSFTPSRNELARARFDMVIDTPFHSPRPDAVQASLVPPLFF